MKKLIALVGLVCLPALLVAQNKKRALDSLLNRYAQEGSFNGSALVAWHGQLLLAEGYGFRNFGDSALNDAQTIFQIASITKQFTATLILKLVELKKMEVTSRLHTYYPDFPNGDRITIYHLLTHTSGIVDRPDSTMHPLAVAGRATHEQQFLAVTQPKKQAFEPGTKRAYSNAGYILLGYIIEKVTGMNYFEAIKKYIFTPLGMNHSGFDMSKLIGADKAMGYAVFTNQVKTEAPPIDPYGPFAAGAICSSVEDLYKWHQGLQAYRIISRASSEQAYTPFINKYGLGWNVDSLSDRRVVSHSGGITGFTSYLSRIPEDDTCIILLNNKPGNNLPMITKQIYAILDNY